MADKQNKDQSTNNRLHSAEVSHDSVLNTTTISLSSIDQSNSSHNILVNIAPEYGSNLFRFRFGEYDLIYTDPELLTKRDFTGTFVLWPFPNRVRDKRYTYQGQSYSLENVHRPGGTQRSFTVWSLIGPGTILSLSLGQMRSVSPHTLMSILIAHTIRLIPSIAAYP